MSSISHSKPTARTYGSLDDVWRYLGPQHANLRERIMDDTIHRTLIAPITRPRGEVAPSYIIGRRNRYLLLPQPIFLPDACSAPALGRCAFYC